MEIVSFEEFKKTELRVGKIKSAEKMEGSEKILKLMVDFGPLGEHQILAGLGKSYIPESLINRFAVFVFNLEPKKIMGFESQGMVLAVDGVNGPVILKPDTDVEPGSMVK